MQREIRIGTRSSKLALWQSNWVSDQIQKKFPSIKVTLVPIKTTGDKILDVSLSKIGGKGLFIKEIEDNLLEDKVDLAVHSLKDMPALLPEGLILAAHPPREDPRDALVSRKGILFKNLPKGAVVGTSSLRRSCQLKAQRRDLNYKDLRGNVDTRLKKLKEGEFDAVILAAAGLKRLSLGGGITEYLDLIPSVGQGALGIEIRADDTEVKNIVSFLDHPQTRASVSVERAFLKEMEAGCQVPLGCHARFEGEKMHIESFLSDVEGETFFRRVDTVLPKEGVACAVSMAREILSLGGREILEKLQFPPT
ncbi:MAG: hydroxymethylbilane synthase [bacterium]|nr:hydroxymethylbilane synthase [bacterium]